MVRSADGSALREELIGIAAGAFHGRRLIAKLGLGLGEISTTVEPEKVNGTRRKPLREVRGDVGKNRAHYFSHGPHHRHRNFESRARPTSDPLP